MTLQKVQKIWFNGELIKWDDANIHILSHVVHYGSGIFEGIRCYDTEKGPSIFRLDDHLTRFFQSAHILQINIPFTHEDLRNGVIETVKASGLKECYIRPFAFFGYSSMGVDPTDCPIEVAIAVWPWGPYLGEGSHQKGVRVTISPWRKFHSSMLPSMAKASGQYLNSFLAVRDARNKGYHEAILLNSEGNIAEGSGQNIFLIKEGSVFTNGADASILLGITRDSVIKISTELGYEVNIKQLSIGELFGADEAFLTGTATEVTPIRELDGRLIGKQIPGELTKNIQFLFNKAVNARLKNYENWLTIL